MTEKRLHHRSTHMLSVLAVFFLLLTFFSNIPANVCTKLDDHLGASKEASIYDSNRPFVDIVSRDEDLSARQQTSLTGFTAGRSLPGQALRTFLVIWMAALVLVFCQFYFLRAPEKAAVRSRSCIIQYIHNLDGKKD